MVDCSTEDLVLLHLGYSDSDRYSKTVPGISEGIGVDKSETARGFRLFSALSDLKENGVIEEKVEYIEDVDDERNTYHLTPKGEERYRELRNEFEKEEIRVKNGTTKEIKLKEVDEHLDFDENALVKTLAEVNSDGVLYLEKDFDDFVGRENELENLNRILDEVRDGNTRAVLVSGPAGIGKTTMIEKAVEEADDFRFLRAKSHQDVSSPYQPVIDALSDIGKDLERILEDHTKPETQDEEVYSTQRKAIFNEFTQHIKETSSQSPLVLFLDDLQWSDNATLDLFSHVIERIDDEPVLFAGTYRIEELDESDKLHEVIDSSDHEIRLDPLGFEETETIVQRLLGEKNVPRSFVELVHQKTGANPMFAEEIVKKLTEKNQVDPRYDMYPDTLDEVDFSNTVESAIHTRLEGLDDTTRELLDICSVVGDSLNQHLLIELSDLDEFSAVDHLDILVDMNILVEDSGNNDSYSFSHDLLRQSVYEEIEEDRKKQLHKNVSRHIRDLYEDRIEDWYNEIANHYDKADELEEALEFYEKAGEKAESVYSNEDAIRNYEKALKIARNLEKEDRVLELIESIAESYVLLGEYGEADTYYEYVWENSDDDERRMRVAEKLSKTKQYKGQIDEFGEVVDMGLEVWDGESPSVGAARLLRQKAILKFRKNEFDEVQETYEKSLEISEALNNDVEIALTLNSYAYFDKYRKEYQEAKEKYRKSIELLKESGKRNQVFRPIMGMERIYKETGEFEKAIEYAENALEIIDETGDVNKKVTTFYDLGNIYYRSGDWEKALEYYKKCLETVKTIDNRGMIGTTTLHIAEIHHHMGKLDKAKQGYDEALELYREVGHKPSYLPAYSDLVDWYWIRNELEKAYDVAESGLEISEEVEITHYKSQIFRSTSRVEKELGNLDRAIELGEEATDMIHDRGDDRENVDSLCVLAEAYLKTGRFEEAHEIAEEAVEISESISAALQLIKSKRTLGMCYRANKEFQMAEQELISSLEIAREIGSKLEECLVLEELVLLENSRDNEEKAKNYVTELENIAEESGFKLFLDE